MSDEASVLEASVLEDGSLLNSLSDHHIFELLLLLKADAIARLRGTSRAIRAAVDQQLPAVLKLRKQPAGRPLQLMHRAEAALLHEDWQGEWRDRWALGPSAPPAGRPAYRVLEVTEGTRAEEPALRQEGGFCVAEEGEAGSEENSSDAEEDERPHVSDAIPARGDVVRLTGMARRGVGRPDLENRQGVLVEWLTLRRRWKVELTGGDGGGGGAGASGADDDNDGGGATTVLVRPCNLVLAEGVCATGAPPPARWLTLSGGWHMNYSGVHRAFGAPMRPRTISFRVYVAATCGARSFFNVYLGSGEQPYKDRAVFWAGSHTHPPEPADVFTLLFDTSGSGQRPAAQMWLPSGRACPVAGHLQPRVWHQVVIHLDWGAMTLRPEFDGRCASHARCMRPPCLSSVLTPPPPALFLAGTPTARASPPTAGARRGSRCRLVRTPCCCSSKRPTRTHTRRRRPRRWPRETRCSRTCVTGCATSTCSRGSSATASRRQRCGSPTCGSSRVHV